MTDWERPIVTKYLNQAVLAGALFFAAATVAATTMAAASAVKLAPHRAVYEISLERAASGSGVVELTGRMVYEITGNACDGYTQNMRFVTRTVDRSGRPSIMDLRSSFWEDGSGERFRFDTNQYRDERLAEAASGDAKREKKGGVAVNLAKPAKRRSASARMFCFRCSIP